VASGGLDWRDEAFLKLAAAKIATEPPGEWLSDDRIEAFRRGLEPELRPVLRHAAFEAFDFQSALGTLRAVAGALRPLLFPG
jgi:hypothetical protein